MECESCMIYVYAICKIKPGCRDAFLKVAESLIHYSRAEAGNVSYHLCEDENDKNLLTFIETWHNEDALKIHLNMPHFIDAGEKMKDLLEKPLDIHKLTAII